MRFYILEIGIVIFALTIFTSSIGDGLNLISLLNYIDHSIKFMHMKKYLQKIPLERRFTVKVFNNGAHTLTEEYGYLHIWKCGGSTIQKQTNQKPFPMDHRDITSRKLIAFVRDPFDHFLSGWAECGSWFFNETFTRIEMDAKSYDERIKNWLQQVKGRSLGCPKHSKPQLNFLLQNTNTFYPNIVKIAKLEDLRRELIQIGFVYDDSIPNARIASESDIKNTYFPSHMSEISEETQRAVCDYIAMDYCFFQFQPPIACKETIEAICREIQN